MENEGLYSPHQYAIESAFPQLLLRWLLLFPFLPIAVDAVGHFHGPVCAYRMWRSPLFQRLPFWDNRVQ